MASAFVKEAARGIRGSLGRFLAIVGISALGCGFYAGLKMCGPDMRAAADAFYDGTALFDVRVVSTLGLADADLKRLAVIEGVSETMPSISFDAMARVADEQMAVRISSLDVDAAARSHDVGTDAVAYEGKDYLNRPMLRQGRWPHAADECVIDADRNSAQLQPGDSVELLYGATDLDELISARTLKVVGLVSSPVYPYTGTFGSTTLGSGMIEEYLFCAPEAFEKDAPYTEAYLRVDGAREQLSESDGYLDVVGKVTSVIEARVPALAQARLDDVVSDAQAELDDARAEFEEARDDAYAELDDAKKKLADAAAELADGERQIADGQRELDDGRATLAASRVEAADKLSDAQAAIDENQRKLDEGAAQLAEGRAELASQQSSYDEGVRELLAGVGASTLDEAPAAIASAQKQLDDGIAQLEAGIAQIEAAPEAARAGIAQAEAGIAEAEAGIAQAQAGIDEADAALAQASAGRTQAVEGKAIAEQKLAEAIAAQEQLPALRTQLEGLQAQRPALVAAIEAASAEERPALEQQLDELDENIQVLTFSIAQLEAAHDAIRAQIAELDAAIAAADDGIARAQAGRDQAVAGKTQAEQGLTQAQAGKAQAEEGLAQALAAQEQLPALRAQLAELEAQRVKLASAAEAAAALLSARDQLMAANTTLEASAAELAQGQAQLDDGRAELARQRADAEARLADGQAQLDDAAAQLVDARVELENGRREYADGLADYTKARADAEAELADAEAEIADAQADIDALEPPDLYVFDRTKSEGAATYHADSERIDSIANVFPLMFFLVAALVSLTSMTRMVEDDRIQIGTYKALGYSTMQIASKYLAYAGLASVTGAVLGICLLSQVLPLIVTWAYSIIYTIPVRPPLLPIDVPIALSAGLVGVGVTLVATWAAVVSSLREVPATLMLPRAPAAGKRIFLERITPLWRRLSFSWKVTFRNLFRYKRRFAMTVIGVSGCTALLLVGFGLHDSIWDIIDCQFGPIVHYDLTVRLDADAQASNVNAVEELLKKDARVSDVARIQAENMLVGTTDTDKTSFITVMVPREVAGFDKMLTLRTRSDHAPVPVDGNAVVVSEKVATLYDLAVGDEILLYDQDAVGNASGEGHVFTLTGIAEYYVGNCAVVGRDVWAQAGEEKPIFQTLLATIADDAGAREELASALSEMSHVSTVAFSSETIDLYRNMLSVVDAVVVLLIVSAGVLAFIVLYNLTNINIGERIREIASLKVLGFTKREVYAYIFREIALLALIGDVLGLLLGGWLENFVVVTAEVDQLMFGRSIHPASYVYSFAITLVFTALILFSMRSKLDRVNMVESLKSVD